MTDALPRQVYAAFAREVIERHTEWDSPHCFMTLRPDGGELRCGTYAILDLDPGDIPAAMVGLAHEQLRLHPDSPACAYLLQIEAFGVKAPGPTASEAEREQFRADRRGGTFHQRADAVEDVTAWLADVHGRLWSATKTRNEPGVITERFYPPGKRPTGRLITGLLAVALGTGLSGPQGAYN